MWVYLIHCYLDSFEVESESGDVYEFSTLPDAFQFCRFVATELVQPLRVKLQHQEFVVFPSGITVL